MKKLLLALLIAVFIGSITAPAFAGGDKNRKTNTSRHQGDNAQGPATRNQGNSK